MNTSALGSWSTIFQSTEVSGALKVIEEQLELEVKHARIYPKAAHRYRALELCPMENTQVVIVGQDPYHGEGQADGLAFSVPVGQAIPPSLRNIYQEIIRDPLINPDPTAIQQELNLHNGDLESWARQGVLLLNTSLSVRENQAGSHQHLPWQTLTKAWIELISHMAPPTVFLLWGKHAQQLKPLIQPRHLILESAHPSPLSAYRGFIGSQPFGKANQWLWSKHRAGIDWLSPMRRSGAQL